jgi:3-hydroxyacyl-[acyl-carrier-protein] dehydratase
MKHTEFEFSVPAAHPCLAGHFPGNPIVPGVLLLDELIENLSASAGEPVVRIVRVKFSSALVPGERAMAQCDVDGERASFRVSVLRGSMRVVVAEGLGMLKPETAR